MARRKPVLKIQEEVKLFLPNKKFIRRLAKIDTGAHYSSIDMSLAKKLNLDKSLKLFNKLCPKFKITKNNFKKITLDINKKYKPDLIKKIPGLLDIKLIPATNGFSVRPYFTVEFKLKNTRIKTKASLADRSHLTYPILIGKEDLKNFYIFPNKKRIIVVKRKTYLGLTEDIVINNNIIKAKIDTGARYSAFDMSLAKKLNLDQSLRLFNKLCPKFKITKNNFKKIKKQIKQKHQSDLIKKIPHLEFITIIPAGNGFSVRPYFTVEFKLKNSRIKTKISFVKRKHLIFLALIGREDMKGFFINPSKNNYNTLL